MNVILAQGNEDAQSLFINHKSCIILILIESSEPLEQTSDVVPMPLPTQGELFLSPSILVSSERLPPACSKLLCRSIYDYGRCLWITFICGDVI